MFGVCELDHLSEDRDQQWAFLIRIVGGGVQLGLFGTATANRPIVLTPGDYDDGAIGGLMTGRGNRSTRRKPAPVPLCPPQTPHATYKHAAIDLVGNGVFYAVRAEAI
jgi:hypothetical protein